MSEIKTEAQTIIENAKTPAFTIVEGVPVMLLPVGEGRWEAKEMSHLLPVPARKKGATTLGDVASFIKVCQAQKLPQSNVYLEVDYKNNKFSATAIFNDDLSQEGIVDGSISAAGWKDHRAVFMPALSVEWKVWTDCNDSWMSQIDFAKFLEYNLPDINSPSGSKLPTSSDVLTFVSQLEETRKVRYGAGVNLQNGMTRLEFIEEGDDKTKGQMEIFREFALAISPFFGAALYQVKAYLRYKIDRNSGQISFSYSLQRADKVLESASKELIAKIEAEAGLTTLFGKV